MYDNITLKIRLVMVANKYRLRIDEEYCCFFATSTSTNSSISFFFLDLFKRKSKSIITHMTPKSIISIFINEYQLKKSASDVGLVSRLPPIVCLRRIVYEP